MTIEINIGSAVDETAGRVPERLAIIDGNQQINYSQFADRARRLARFLSDRGLGCFAERSTLEGYESGQDLMAQYLYNGAAYLEGMIGAYLARAAPFNVNYRYVADELRYLLLDSSPRAIQYHAGFAPLLAEVLPEIGSVDLLLQVGDGSGNPLLPGAIDYEEALASVPPSIDIERSPDDLFVLYTGGTTGMPKGVLWRQADIAIAAVGLINRRTGSEWESSEARLDAIRPEPLRTLACAPFMHGAAQWAALQSLSEGNTMVIQSDPTHFDPADVWDVVERERVNILTIVGDAFGRPLAEEIEARPRDVDSLRFIVSGGAALQPIFKERLMRAAKNLQIIDTIGSSETGVQGRRQSGDAESAKQRTFAGDASTVVLTEDLSAVVGPGHEETGWLASRGRVPLGYLGDPAKTAKTFPVVDSVRRSVTGDRARVLGDGSIELLGRDSVTINSGGEKIFAEEVEAAVKAHPEVADAVVCGRPSERWGSEVVAIVLPASGTSPNAAEIIEFCGLHVARYKQPKDVFFVDEIVRSPSGKADYRWAAELVSSRTRT